MALDDVAKRSKEILTKREIQMTVTAMVYNGSSEKKTNLP